MAAPEEALSAGNVMLTGADGASINAYEARPAGDGPFGGVLVIHHLPGWDSGTKEITRRFAAEGYNAICPNLYARQGLEVDPDDAAATRESPRRHSRATNIVERCQGRHRGAPSAPDVERQGRCDRLLLGRAPSRFLTAVSLPVDAAVGCYGAFVTGTVPEGFPLKVTPLVGRAGDLHCPLLGLFGNDDQFPSPEQVDELEAALKDAAGKAYEFHRYDGAGCTFFSVEPPGAPTGPSPPSMAGSASSIDSFSTHPVGGVTHVLVSDRSPDNRRQRQGALRGGSTSPRAAGVH